MKLIKVSKGQEKEIICDPLTDIKVILEDDAKLKVICIQNAQTNSKTKRTSKIGTNAKLKWVDYWLAGSVELDSEDNLNGTGAEVKRVGIFFGSGKQEFNSNIKVNHNAPRTTSNLVTRGALDGKAKTTVIDTIKIKSGSKNSIGKQKTDILLLSDEAFAEAVPQLEIEEEEVNCSHGAAIGKVNSDNLFYIMSRGLSEKEARNEVVRAFFEPILAEVRDEEMVCALRESVSQKIGGLK